MNMKTKTNANINKLSPREVVLSWPEQPKFPSIKIYSTCTKNLKVAIEGYIRSVKEMLEPQNFFSITRKRKEALKLAKKKKDIIDGAERRR